MTAEGDTGLATLGRYELITQIGHGGMAEVRLALQRGPGGFEKLVVIKLIHNNLASQKTFVDMLLDEARVAALVKHPNVVDIYDLGEADGRFFIAMEYLEGEPLLGLLRAGRDGKRLDPLSTARLIADTAEGLDAAHELRTLAGEPMELVHHDVSLGNIVVLYNGQVKLVDFGVAKATQTTAPTGKVHGKFGYMAPEKLRGSGGDRRSDIWSLGVVLWEALTLRRLFKGSNDKDTIKLVLDYQIPRPSAINGDVNPDLDAFVMRALERDPECRYQTAKELAQDLEEVLRVNGYGGRNDLIAKYMQSTFATHIEARKKLLQEVSTKGRASAAVLQAAFADNSGAHPMPTMPTTPLPVPQGPRAIRPSGEFGISFQNKKRPTIDTPVTGNPHPPIGTQQTQTPTPTPTPTPMAEGTPNRTTSAQMAAQEILARRASDELMAEGTPHSGVHEIPRKRITNHPRFAEATPIIPESDLRLGVRADTMQEGDGPGETLLDLGLINHYVEHAAKVMDAVQEPIAEVPTGSGSPRISQVMGVAAAEVVANADASLDLSELLEAPIDLAANLDDEAKREIEIARGESLGRAISSVLERWPETTGARTEETPALPQRRRKKVSTTKSPVLTPLRKSQVIEVEPGIAMRVERKIWPYVLGVLILLIAGALATLLVLYR